jgi:hypothetical protein
LFGDADAKAVPPKPSRWQTATSSDNDDAAATLTKDIAPLLDHINIDSSKKSVVLEQLMRSQAPPEPGPLKPDATTEDYKLWAKQRYEYQAWKQKQENEKKKKKQQQPAQAIATPPPMPTKPSSLSSSASGSMSSSSSSSSSDVTGTTAASNIPAPPPMPTKNDLKRRLPTKEEQVNELLSSLVQLVGDGLEFPKVDSSQFRSPSSSNVNVLPTDSKPKPTKIPPDVDAATMVINLLFFVCRRNNNFFFF